MGDNILERNIGWGSCTQLKGKILFYGVFVNDPIHEWGEGEKKEQKANCQWVADYLMKHAEAEKVALKIRTAYAVLRIPKEFTKDSKVLLDGLVKLLSCRDMKEVVKSLCHRSGAEQVAVLFFHNSKGRSYATSADKYTADYSEFLVVYGKEKLTILHETLHLFGAVDFYYPERVRMLADKHSLKSVMYNSQCAKIDEVTRYLIGWHKEPSLNTRRFLELTKEITDQQLKDSMKAEWTDGYRVIHYPGGECKYEGECKAGIPCGQGKMSWNDGSVLTGMFRDGAANGQGELHYSNGAVYKGAFVNGTCQGQGVLTYQDGSVYKGEFYAGKPEGSGTLHYASGQVTTGRFKNGKPV